MDKAFWVIFVCCTLLIGPGYVSGLVVSACYTAIPVLRSWVTCTCESYCAAVILFLKGQISWASTAPVCLYVCQQDYAKVTGRIQIREKIQESFVQRDLSSFSSMSQRTIHGSWWKYISMLQGLISLPDTSDAASSGRHLDAGVSTQPLLLTGLYTDCLATTLSVVPGLQSIVRSDLCDPSSADKGERVDPWQHSPNTNPPSLSLLPLTLSMPR